MTVSASYEAPRNGAALLGAAVHRNSALSRDGMLERLFTTAFRGLVYPQIWEDPRVDLEALSLGPDDRMVTIASGGCNVLSYLAAGPAHITAVDLNATHAALNKLKLAAVKTLPTHAAFYDFFGHADLAHNTVVYDRVIAPALDETSRAYWERRDALGRRHIDRFATGFYRAGLLGWCIGTAHMLARLHGKNPRRMLAARNRAEQIAIFDAELAPLFDSPLIRRTLGHRAALYGLGIPPAQYTALLGEESHMADVVRARLRKLACDFELSDNYFAWQAFNRAYAPAGAGPLPPYLEAANFDALKANADRVSVMQTSFTTLLEAHEARSLDCYVLLDAQDWMDDATLTALWSELTRTARPGARVIFRTAGVPTILPGRVPDAILGAWEYAQARSEALLARDRSAIYGGFHLYVRTGG